MGIVLLLFLQAGLTGTEVKEGGNATSLSYAGYFMRTNSRVKCRGFHRSMLVCKICLECLVLDAVIEGIY